LIGLTSLWINGRSGVSLELNHRRAVFVLGNIDEILTWERTKEQETVRFVELANSMSFWHLKEGFSIPI
jgi:hypothetical protein